MTRRLATQRLTTTHDTNGNPRRLQAVYDLDAAGDMVALYNEDYSGPRIVFDDMTVGERAEHVELPPWEITPAEYRAALDAWRISQAK